MLYLNVEYIHLSHRVTMPYDMYYKDPSICTLCLKAESIFM